MSVCNYVIFLANAQLARSFFKICVRNHQTFQNSCVESSKVGVPNHQDNNFLINIECRSDANMINLLCAAIFANFELKMMIWSYFATYISCYVMCQTPTWGRGGGLIAFYPKMSSWLKIFMKRPLFPDNDNDNIRWHSHHCAGIGIEKQLGKQSQCCNESSKYCRWLLPMTKMVGNSIYITNWRKGYCHYNQVPVLVAEISRWKHAS